MHLCIHGQVGRYVYENFGKLTPEGGPPPSNGTDVEQFFNDGLNFAQVRVQQPQEGELAPGPAPALPNAVLATQISSAPALPPSAAPAVAPAPGPSAAST